jgi:hypothetical protein
MLLVVFFPTCSRRPLPIPPIFAPILPKSFGKFFRTLVMIHAERLAMTGITAI